MCYLFLLFLGCFLGVSWVFLGSARWEQQLIDALLGTGICIDLDAHPLMLSSRAPCCLEYHKALEYTHSP
jgi:hypothetical protein